MPTHHAPTFCRWPYGSVRKPRTERQYRDKTSPPFNVLDPFILAAHPVHEDQRAVLWETEASPRRPLRSWLPSGIATGTRCFT